MKKRGLMGKKYLIGILILFSVFTIGLISAAGESVGFNYSNASNLRNYGNYTTWFNLSVYSNVINTTGPYNVTLYCNKSGGAIDKVGSDTIKIITLSNNSASGTRFETAYVNISFLSVQGNESRTFNCSLYANNQTTHFWSDIDSIHNITFDSTPPNVSSTLEGIVNYGNYTGIITLNVSANDAVVGMDSVSFNITYSNGSQVNYSQATVSGGYYSISVNTTTFTDGYYNLTVDANDTLDNRNTSTALFLTFDSTPPNVSLTFVSPLPYANYSNTTRLISINITVNDKTIGLERGSVWFNITYSNGTQMNFSRGILLSGYYNLTLNTTELAGFGDGKYNITVYANDSLNNLNSSISTQISMDRTPPNVSSTLEGIVNYGNYTGIITLNVSANDAVVGMDSVSFNITYSNGSQVNYSQATVSGGYYSVSINTTTFTDGYYNLTVVANDTLGNKNDSTTLFLTFDNTAPTGSLSCFPINLYTGGVVTCDCSGNDDTSNVSSIAFTVHPPTVKTGKNTAYCVITDYAGNSLTLSEDYTVDLSGSSSRGGGGGGGVTTTSNQTSKFTTEVPVTTAQLFNQILPSTPIVMSNFDSGTGISKIQIEVSQEADNVQVTIDKYESKPANVSVEKNDTYKYLHIETQNLTGKLNKAVISIQVEKSWISSNGLNKEDISLFRYNETSNQWNQLPTTFDKEDSTYYYYNVELNGFSYFAIASNEVSTAEQQAEMIGGMSYWLWIIIAAVILLAILIVRGFSKKRKENSKKILISSSPKKEQNKKILIPNLSKKKKRK